jgi:hypothetical protein
MKRASVSLLLLALAALTPATTRTLMAQQPSLFQELGAFAISASSNHPEVPSPRGFGFASWWQFKRHLLGRLSYHRVSDKTVKDGVVCDQYSQRINCRPEVTDTDVRLSGLRATLLGTLVVKDRLRLGAGGGVSFNHIDTEAKGVVSGRIADLLAPNAGVIGFTTLVSATLHPFYSLPIRLSGGYGVHWVNFNTCSANDPPQYDPYCGREALTELEFGLSLVF